MRCPGCVWWSLAVALAVPGEPLSGGEPVPIIHTGPAVFHSAAPRPAAAVFAGGLTDVKVRLTVEDTASGTVRIYENPLRTPFAALQDTQAFLCP